MRFCYIFLFIHLFIINLSKKLLICYYDSDPDEANIKGQLFIINSLSVDELINEAHKVLGDNSLNNEQRKN